MNRTYHAKRVTLALACLLLGFCAPALDDIADVVMDGDGGGDALPDAVAEVDIPPGCDCEAPILALDERLSAIEAGFEGLDDRFLTRTAQGTFGMRVSTNGGGTHSLIVPGSSAYVAANIWDVSTTGEPVWARNIVLIGIDPVSRTRVNLYMALDEPVDFGPIPLAGRTTWLEIGLDYTPAENRCTAQPVGGGSVDGTITFTRVTDRLVGTFSMTVTCSDGTSTRTITDGRLDLPAPPVSTTGAYVPS